MTPLQTPDLSIVLFACDHVPTFHGCVHAARRARGLAESAGFSVQSLVVMHAQQARVASWCSDNLDASWEILTSGETIGSALRNAAAGAARGRYLAWADGTDLWSANWLLAGLRGVISEGGIWHPEMLLTYSGDHFSTEGMTFRLFSEADGEVEALLSADTLPTGFLCERELMESFPFPEEDAARGLGEVERWWHCNIASAGQRHRIMPATFHYRRRFWHELAKGETHWRMRERMGSITWPADPSPARRAAGATATSAASA